MTRSSLTERKIAQIQKRGRYRDNLVPGLYLHVDGNGRSWVLRYEFAGHERAMGLGSARLFTLKEIRARALSARRLLFDGVDPLTVKRAAQEQSRKIQIANKWREYADHGIEPTCFLYRHYDACSDLLYVGMTLHVWDRQKKHLQNAEWANSIYQILVEPFAYREELIEAEAYAIKTEFPKFNHTHNDRTLRRALAAPTKEVSA
jgi:hypothetical protein